MAIDHETREPLMLAYMNEESLKMTIENGRSDIARQAIIEYRDRFWVPLFETGEPMPGDLALDEEVSTR